MSSACLASLKSGLILRTACSGRGGTRLQLQHSGGGDERTKDQSHPQVCNEFEDSLGYMRPNLKKVSRLWCPQMVGFAEGRGGRRIMNSRLA